jgi:ABC-type branched-subunit amino acid transport system permease subunit
MTQGQATHKGHQHGLRTLYIWFGGIALVWLFHFFVGPEMNPYYFRILMFTGINIILAVSLNLVNGYTGQFSMGHAGFMSVGGYVAAFLTLTARDKYPLLFSG